MQYSLIKNGSSNCFLNKSLGLIINDLKKVNVTKPANNNPKMYNLTTDYFNKLWR